MELFLQKLKDYLNNSDPNDFRVISSQDINGTSIVYTSYKQLLDAYNQALQINSQIQLNAYRPIKFGRGNR